ncbi:MAG: cache domain-containing protein, partial [Victivallales bacterium]|nr:cache domain-containing protein [Victivallales bacterium]
MHGSLRSRILLVVGGIIIITAGALCYTVHYEVGRAFSTQTEVNAENILNALVAGVENEYHSIDYFRARQYAQRREELENLVAIATELVHGECRQAQRQHDVAAKQQEALAELRSFRYQHGVGYFWVAECRPGGKVLMNALMPELEGKPLAATELDPATGRPLMDSFIRLCREKGEGFLEYHWPKPGQNALLPATNKISFVKWFKPWNWIIGTGVYLDDIDTAIRKRRDAVIHELHHTVATLNIGHNGYAFIFNDNLQVLAHPRYCDFDNGDDKQVVREGRQILDRIVTAAKAGKKQIDYRWFKPDRKDGKYMKRVYFRYLPPFKCYVCLAYYVDDINAPLAALNTRLMFLSAAALLLALAVSLFLAWTLSAPLRRLAAAAEAIGREGMDAAAIPVSGSSETRELGQILAQVIDTIREKEFSLKSSEENLRITLASIGDAVIATDIDGRIIRMNRAAEEVTDWKFAEARGCKLQDGIKLADPITAEPIPSPIDAVLVCGKPCNLSRKTIMISHVGVKKLIDDSCSPIVSLNGQLLGVVIAFRDITAQVQTELQLLQSQKMDSLGQLAGGVAHDFNNMLAGMMACAEMLKRKLNPDQTV